MSVIDDLLAKQPETRTVHVPLEPELAKEWDMAKQAVLDAERAFAAARQEVARAGTTAGMVLLQDDMNARQRDVEEAKERLAEAEERLRANTVRFVLSSVTPETFKELKQRCPPTPEQRKQARSANEKVEWDPDTFQPALVATACKRVESPRGTQDGLSEEEATRMWASPEWNVGLRNELFSAALQAYYFFTRIDLPKS